MRVLPMLGVALGAASIAAPAWAQSPVQPPMDSLNNAYYLCDDGAFLMSYDDNPPQNATMTTSDDNKQYALKRAADANGGVQFSGDGASFWTDGKTVVVGGTPRPFRNCKMKSG
jgi:membrane-bound inhibitor of C-type lysozyme